MAKIQRLMSLNKLPLLREDELPADFREIAIISGYRHPQSTVQQCLLSIFAVTNETLNIWTHFIPTVYFCWKLAALCDAQDVVSNPYSWPFVSYMITVCLYPFISAMAHTFYSMSKFARHVWFFLDYGALSIYGYGAGLLYRAYVFPEDLLNTVYADLFLPVCLCMSILCVVLACSSRFIKCLLWMKVFRLGAFVLPWAWDSVPLVYRLMTSCNLDCPSAVHYLRQFAFSALIGFLYASHLPERLAPGKFDIIGHSHQLFHICGILATNEQMNGARIDLQLRKNYMIAHNEIVSPVWSVTIFASLVFGIGFIIFFYSMYALFEERSENKTECDSKKNN